ncbi:cell wall protein [Streptomyces sp. BE147]|uniref:cell wall protein n=1 Tax=Streptomyces sp. BE147 TaxID=3002524 RepID=UPI002E79847A|nr:cell wall protein [Streptomyces sp. BE147]MEE1735474.1 cell wall protein [Streptomyces sp. BE147]
MSAGAAATAVLDHPLPEDIDNMVDEFRSRVPGQRNEPQPEVRQARVLGRGQDIVWTRSRRAEPRAWLRAVVWLVAAGLHREAGPTTLMVAGDLAARMDYRRGLVIYDLEGTARRTSTSPATVKRHVKVLRELGALVWLVHGSKRNIAAPGEGYMATATIYGAVIPPVFDEAMGHRLTGSGYEGRVCGVTEAGRERAVEQATVPSEARHRSQRRTERQRPSGRRGDRVRTAHPVDNPAMDNSRSQAREPHSPGSYHRSPAVQVDGGCKDTSRERATCRTAPRPSFKISYNVDGSRRTAGQTQRGIGIIQQVRPRVTWTQRASLRELEVALRPVTDAGWDWPTITAELHSWHLTWRPARPAAYIRARLARQATAEHQTAAAEVAEGWDEQEASGPLAVSSPDLVRSVLDGLAEGLATYSARQAELGLDDLTDQSAAATMAAFLSSGTGAPA